MRKGNESQSYDVFPQLGNPHHQTYFFKLPDEEICVLRLHAMKSRKDIYKLGFQLEIVTVGLW